MHNKKLVMRPSRWFLEKRGDRHLFQWNRVTKSNFFRETGEKDNIGEQGIEEKKFSIWGPGEQANLFQGNKGTGTPWKGLSNN